MSDKYDKQEGFSDDEIWGYDGDNGDDWDDELGYEDEEDTDEGDWLFEALMLDESDDEDEDEETS